MAKIYSFLNNKGGVLKSSLCTNIAGLLSKQKGNKILIIDVDSQANSATSFNKNPDQYEKTLQDVLCNKLDPKQAIYELYKNIDILPSNDKMNFIEIKIAKMNLNSKVMFNLLNNAVKSVEHLYTHILIDCPPNLSILNGMVLYTENNNVIIPFHPEPFALRSMLKTVAGIMNFKQENPTLNIKALVPTKIKNTTLHADVLQSTRKFCSEQGVYASETVISESIRYPEAVTRKGLPLTLTDYKDDDKIVGQYINLIKELKLNEKQ